VHEFKRKSAVEWELLQGSGKDDLELCARPLFRRRLRCLRAGGVRDL